MVEERGEGEEGWREKCGGEGGWCVVLRCAVVCQAVLWYVNCAAQFCGVLCLAVSCCMLFCVVPGCAVPSCVVLCCVLLCCAVLRCA